MNPEWIDPHDWTVDKDPLKQLCPQTETCKPCTNTAKSEYLRLVNSLFNPNEFRVCKLFDAFFIGFTLKRFAFFFRGIFSLTSQQITFIVVFTFISQKNNWKNYENSPM